jgi:Site-specific recombinase XerD
MQSAIDHFLDTLDRSPKTIRAYRYGLRRFVEIVGESAPLDIDTYEKFLKAIIKFSPSTKQIWRSAVLGLYSFCKAGNWIELKEISKHYTRKQGKRIVNFNRAELEKVIAYCETLHGDLLALRDRAFVLTLVDTGLRISEACALKRGDIDWQEQRAVIIGKGDKQAVIRFSDRSIRALKEYLALRASVDPNSRMSLSSQPLFARHDISASKKIKAVGTGGMWETIKERMTEAGIDKRLVRIHDFRHYFVTMIYLAAGDLKLSQELARHESIVTTNRYAHFGGEADKAYDQIFNKNKLHQHTGELND